MKKLQLKMQELNNPVVLTREQLKNVLGGDPPVTTKYYDCDIVEKDSSGTVTGSYTLQVSGLPEAIQPHADGYCAGVVSNHYAASCTACCDVPVA